MKELSIQTKRFTYEDDPPDLPDMSPPSTFNNEKPVTKYVTADDGNRVPELPLPVTFPKDEKKLANTSDDDMPDMTPPRTFPEGV